MMRVLLLLLVACGGSEMPRDMTVLEQSGYTPVTDASDYSGYVISPEPAAVVLAALPSPSTTVALAMVDTDDEGLEDVLGFEPIVEPLACPSGDIEVEGVCVTEATAEHFAKSEEGPDHSGHDHSIYAVEHDVAQQEQKVDDLEEQVRDTDVKLEELLSELERRKEEGIPLFTKDERSELEAAEDTAGDEQYEVIAGALPDEFLE